MKKHILSLLRGKKSHLNCNLTIDHQFICEYKWKKKIHYTINYKMRNITRGCHQSLLAKIW